MRTLVVLIGLAACGDNQAAVLVPTIEGDWWNIAGNPDLGPLTGDGQQPVDFTVWQAADSSWNLWSCIRFTKVGGNTRLFFHWQSPSLLAPDWT